MAILFLFASLLASFISQVHAVTLTSTSSAYTVDANSANAFKFTVSRSSCDITSIVYRGSEVQYPSTGSHISSGLGSATVSAQTISSGGVNYVKITCTTPTLTHYMVVRDTDSTIHMMTSTTAEPSIGELRWIARLNRNLLPYDDVNQASDIGSGSTAVEGSDVYLLNGQTRSKFYSSQRFIDDKVHCLSGDTMKACMVLPGTAYETSSGGPFMRDIDTNPGGSYNTVYWYMNSGHAKTEEFRTGLFGPYALQFSRSGRPSDSVDLQFWSGLSIPGFVPVSSRGYVSGKASGIDTSKFKITAHWFNNAAQYWTYADSSSNFYSPAMKPGTYTMIIYQDELKVATKTGVVVSAGQTNANQNLASTWNTPSSPLFQIGDWDGQPQGFRNADKIERMHPSDSRMSSWGPLTYTVGSSSLNDFPMAIFKGVNTPATIKFTLNSNQASGAATLRVGTTLSFAGARPSVSVNGKALTIPAAPNKIDSRGVTRGTWRGYGEVYTFAVAAGSLVNGANTVTIDVASGSSGDKYLSPNFIFDAVDLYR